MRKFTWNTKRNFFKVELFLCSQIKLLCQKILNCFLFPQQLVNVNDSTNIWSQINWNCSIECGSNWKKFFTAIKLNLWLNSRSRNLKFHKFSKTEKSFYRLKQRQKKMNFWDIVVQNMYNKIGDIENIDLLRYLLNCFRYSVNYHFVFFFSLLFVFA